MLESILHQNGEAILAFSLPWETNVFVELLQSVQGEPRFYWANPNDRLKIAGYGIAASITAKGEDRFERVGESVARTFQRLVVNENELPSFVRSRLLGGFSFYPTLKRGMSPDWQGFSPALFVLPRVLFTQAGEETWVTFHLPISEGLSISEIKQWVQNNRAEVEDYCRGLSKEADSPPGSPVVLERENFPGKDVWLEVVGKTVGQIRMGGLQKAVLSRALLLRPRAGISVGRMMAHLGWRYPGCYNFWIEPSPGRAFCGATPELLADVRDGYLHTAALAGSTRRGSSFLEDTALGWGLLLNQKNRHEHQFVVDAVREGLEGLVDPINCPERPRLRKLANIQHLQTPIYGPLIPDANILTLLAQLHPTPALGGVPQNLALEYIKKAEASDRGWYAAPVGWLGPNGEGTFAVGIRSALITPKEVVAFAGAGIMAESDPQKEWIETEMKLMPLVNAVEAAVH